MGSRMEREMPRVNYLRVVYRNDRLIKLVLPSKKSIPKLYELFNLLLNALRTHISPDRLFTWIRCGR